MALSSRLRRAVNLGQAANEALIGLHGAGLLSTVPLRLVPDLVRDVYRAGRTPAALLAVSAARHPDSLAIRDERTCLSYRALQQRMEALAAGLAGDFGIGPGSTVALMCRNHADLIVALFAVARLGADQVLLNTEFPAGQLAQILNQRPYALVIHDEEFSASIKASGYPGRCLLAWQEDAQGGGIAALVAQPHPTAARQTTAGKLVILTSGTTGLPKGANRGKGHPAALGILGSVLRTLPVRRGDGIVVAPPVFHGFGLALSLLGIAIGAPLILRRRFDAAQTLSDITQQNAKLLVAVPVMLQRLLDAPSAPSHDLSGLSVLCGAAPLPGTLARRWMDAHGDRLYNGYGSTEVGLVALSGPHDQRAAPGCVGRAPAGVTVRIRDGAGRNLPAGEIGHICIGSPLLIEGYIDGGNKSHLAGLMNTGDLGHVDAGGRLHVDGREDDMIVSGGENIYPQEIEEALAAQADVLDVAVIGVPDAEFGQRLRAFVVRRDQTVSEDTLRAHLKQQVARFKIPREFIFVDSLQRNPSGKVLRRVLASQGDAA